MTEIEAQEAVRAMGVRLSEAGLVVGTWGNVSLRVGDSMAVTPSGADYGALSAADVPIVDLATGEWRGPKPSSERDLHLAIYRERKEVRAVIHAHSPNACTVAAAGRELPPILDDMAQILGPSVRVADYALPTTRKLVKATLKALRGRMAALMANHGAVCLGRDMEEAFLCCQVLEKSCRSFIEAEFLGGAKSLGRVEAYLMHQYFLRKYSRQWKS